MPMNIYTYIIIYMYNVRKRLNCKSGKWGSIGILYKEIGDHPRVQDKITTSCISPQAFLSSYNQLISTPP